MLQILSQTGRVLEHNGNGQAPDEVLVLAGWWKVDRTNFQGSPGEGGSNLTQPSR